MERVDSMSTLLSSPFVIAITSFEASMLKAPPKKNPIIPDKIIVTTIVSFTRKNIVKHPHIIRQE